MLGYAKISLESVFSILGKMSSDDIKLFMLMQDRKMIQVFNQHVEVKSMAENKNRGFLNSMLAIGNLRSIDLYNQENKSMRSTAEVDEG